MSSSYYVPYTPSQMHPVITHNYLKMIAHTMGAINQNYGALRKQIWAVMQQEFKKQVSYHEFLQALYWLKNYGKVIQNEVGYIYVDKMVYDEIKHERENADKQKLEHSQCDKYPKKSVGALNLGGTQRTMALLASKRPFKQALSGKVSSKKPGSVKPRWSDDKDAPQDLPWAMFVFPDQLRAEDIEAC
jgi:hypothetical protein